MSDFDNDDVSYVYEPTVIKYTPYDRRLMELNDLRAKRAAIAVQADGQHQLASLDFLIQRAEKRFEVEKQRATDDAWRKRRNIDDWRSGDGKEMRNATRRKVRSAPNVKLTGYTAAEKEQRKRYQRADANFRKRLEAKGTPEHEIQAALKIREEKRLKEPKTARPEPNPYEDHPDFGRF